MKTIKPLNNNQCCRSKCKEPIYTKNKFAQQLLLCKNHFDIYKNRNGQRCHFCHFIFNSKTKKVKFCSHQCEAFYEMTQRRWFNFVDEKISHLINEMPDNIHYLFIATLTHDGILALIYFIQKIHNSIIYSYDVISKKNLNIFNQKYFSILDFSPCYKSAILGDYYCIIPSVFWKGKPPKNRLVEILQRTESKESHSTLFTYLNNLENDLSAPDIDTDFLKMIEPHLNFIFSFSDTEPYHAYPILRLFENHMSNTNLVLDESEVKILTDIKSIILDLIKYPKRNVLPFYIELCILVLFYSFVFRRYDEKSYIELANAFLSSQKENYLQLCEYYLEKWFEIEFYQNDAEKENAYLKFYQSLFLIYKQEIPNINASA